MALPNAILTSQQVTSIKAAIFKGATIEKLARSYDVNYRTISHIKCGRTWEEVAWPDGTTGAIAAARRIELVRLRMQQRGSRKRRRANGRKRK